MATVDGCSYCQGSGHDDCCGPCIFCKGSGLRWEDDFDPCEDCGFMSCDCDDYVSAAAPPKAGEGEG